MIVRTFIVRYQNILFGKFYIQKRNEKFFFDIPLSGLTTIGATFAPTSVRAKIFNIHFQRTYATESNSA